METQFYLIDGILIILLSILFLILLLQNYKKQCRIDFLTKLLEEKSQIENILVNEHECLN